MRRGRVGPSHGRAKSDADDDDPSVRNASTPRTNLATLVTEIAAPHDLLLQHPVHIGPVWDPVSAYPPLEHLDSAYYRLGGQFVSNWIIDLHQFSADLDNALAAELANRCRRFHSSPLARAAAASRAIHRLQFPRSTAREHPELTRHCQKQARAMLEVCRNLGIPCRYELVSGQGPEGRFVHVVNRITTTRGGRRYDYVIDANQYPGVVLPIDRWALLAARQADHLVDRAEVLRTTRSISRPGLNR